jgi:general secretion pathway protein F
MSTYHYKALAADGKTLTGTLAVDDDRSAARELRRQGLTPVFIGTSRPGGLSLKLPQFAKRRSHDVLHFTREIATLLNAGVPLERALTITSEITERPQFRSVIGDLLKSLRGGKSFAESLAAQEGVFSELYVSMVRAGEVSGSLPLVMDRLADFERSRDELRGYIISSLTYPALLTLVGAGSIFVLLRFVIPRFAEAFTTSNIAMPLPMQVLLGVSDFVRTFGWIFFVLLIGAVVGWRMWVRSPEGRLGWDRLRLRIPLLGAALLKADTARFARAMATLVANGVPLVQSIGITKGILTNRVLSQALDPVAQGIKRGEGIAAPLRKTGKFPALAGHLLTVGEETGHLDRMFERMADIYDKDTREAVKRFTALFEPIVILIMGIIVGAMILSIMLAITSVNQLGM